MAKDSIIINQKKKNQTTTTTTTKEPAQTTTSKAAKIIMARQENAAATTTTSSKLTTTTTTTTTIDDDNDDNNVDEEEEDSSSAVVVAVFQGGTSSSPYEDAENHAEVGEPLWEEFQALLTPAPAPSPSPGDDDDKEEEDESAAAAVAASSSRSNTGRHRRRRTGNHHHDHHHNYMILEPKTPTRQAIETLGSGGSGSGGSFEMAHAMVTAYDQISWSGIVYSPEWRDTQHIRGGGVPIPGLTPTMILLCLRPDRLFRADAAVLTRLSKELGVTGIVQKAIAAWNLDEKFPKLASSTASTASTSCCFSYQRSHRLACLKCAIFVARSFECMTLLGVQQQQPQ